MQKLLAAAQTIAGTEGAARIVARQEVTEPSPVTFGTDEVEAALANAAGLVDGSVQEVFDDFGNTADSLATQITALVDAIQAAAASSVGEIDPVLQKLLEAAQAVTGTSGSGARLVARQEETAPEDPTAAVTFGTEEVETALANAAELVDGSVQEVFDDFGNTADSLATQITNLVEAIEVLATSSVGKIDPVLQKLLQAAHDITGTGGSGARLVARQEETAPGGSHRRRDFRHRGGRGPPSTLQPVSSIPRSRACLTILVRLPMPCRLRSPLSSRLFRPLPKPQSAKCSPSCRNFSRLPRISMPTAASL